MDVRAGVDRAVIVPPIWAGDDNANLTAVEACRPIPAASPSWAASTPTPRRQGPAGSLARHAAHAGHPHQRPAAGR